MKKILIALTLAALAQTASSAPFSYVASRGDNSATAGTISVIDESNFSVRTLTTGLDNPFSLAASQDGKNVYVPTRKGLYEIDTNNGAKTLIQAPTPGYESWGAAIHPNGRYVYWTNNDRSLWMYDRDLKKPYKVISSIFPGDNGWALDFSPDGKSLYIVSYGLNQVAIIDTIYGVPTGVKTIINTLLGGGVTSAGFSPDGKKYYIGTSYSDKIFTIDTTTYATTSIINGTYKPYGTALSPDGKKLYVAIYYSNLVKVYDTQSFLLLKDITVGNVYSIETNNFTGKVYAVNLSGSTVSIIDSNTDTVISTVSVPNAANFIAVPQPLVPDPLPSSPATPATSSYPFELAITTNKTTYTAGETLVTTISEPKTPTIQEDVDLWFGVQIPSGGWLFFIDNPFVQNAISNEPSPFVRGISTHPQSDRTALNFTIPSGMKGTFKFSAVYAKKGTQPDDLAFELRSNVATTTITIQ